ncbi:MAG: hypothetical protein EAY72_10495 [Bacteroidetes bacterium]|nr:MAG: hypothetical protein EAY72_10495 [Bacteroidota bacterium]TAE64841.1 MAG: hypothetical protein EAY68_06980 [Bacteroidota bacterium]
MQACTSRKQLIYFNDLPDSTVINLPPLVQEQRIIQPGDGLNIMVSGANPEAVAQIMMGISMTGNMQQGMGMMAGGADEIGRIVDPEGMLDLPKLGRFKVVGMDNFQLRDTLTKVYSKYIKDIIVTVNFARIRFSVLGIGRGTVLSLPNQRTTILDALAAAGNLPNTVKRYDIQVYRDYNGKRQIFKIDLRSKDILYNSQQFQIRHNDVLILQPRNISFVSQEVGIFASFFGVLVALTTLLVTLIPR